MSLFGEVWGVTLIYRSRKILSYNHKESEHDTTCCEATTAQGTFSSG
ncbi:hypothetical protein LCGC14_2265540, partial [marine sediment metagenome]